MQSKRQASEQVFAGLGALEIATEGNGSRRRARNSSTTERGAAPLGDPGRCIRG